MKLILTAMVVLVYLLHQDLWFWHDRTLVLGFLPIGLAYHAAYSILAAIMMAVLVRFAWPSHLEDTAAPTTSHEPRAASRERSEP